VRRVARRVVEQGLLHGPGADRAYKVSRAGQAPADAGVGRWTAAATRIARAARGSGGWYDAVRTGRHGACRAAARFARGCADLRRCRAVAAPACLDAGALRRRGGAADTACRERHAGPWAWRPGAGPA